MDGDPERRPFLDKLLHFMEERGTPIAQCPTISKNPLDLYRLYLYTKEKGGFMEVCMPCPAGHPRNSFSLFFSGKRRFLVVRDRQAL